MNKYSICFSLLNDGFVINNVKLKDSNELIGLATHTNSNMDPPFQSFDRS